MHTPFLRRRNDTSHAGQKNPSHRNHPYCVYCVCYHPDGSGFCREKDDRMLIPAYTRIRDLGARLANFHM